MAEPKGKAEEEFVKQEMLKSSKDQLGEASNTVAKVKDSISEAEKLVKDNRIDEAARKIGEAKGRPKTQFFGGDRHPLNLYRSFNFS